MVQALVFDPNFQETEPHQQVGVAELLAAAQQAVAGSLVEVGARQALLPRAAARRTGPHRVSFAQQEEGKCRMVWAAGMGWQWMAANAVEGRRWTVGDVANSWWMVAVIVGSRQWTLVVAVAGIWLMVVVGA